MVLQYQMMGFLQTLKITFCLLQANFVTKAGEVSKADELCINNEKFCIKNEELCIKNDEFCRRCARSSQVIKE